MAEQVVLRSYQQQAATRIIDELRDKRSTLLVLATGLGKTVVFSSVAAKAAAKGRRTLVLAHRRELLEQASATLQRFGVSAGFELADDRIDLGAIPNAVLATVQTLRGPRLGRWPRDAFGLVVVDEAHHSVAKTYRAIIEHFATAKILGVTATPDRTDEVALGHIYDSVAFTMGIREGVKEGWLAPVELRSVVVESLDLRNVHTVAGDLDRSELETELVRDEVLHQVAKPLAELAHGRRTIAFVAGVAQAHALADVLRGYGVTAEAVDGSMPGDERDAIRNRYMAGSTQIVVNCSLYTEGFDAPETSCIALVRPTSSRSLLCQMIGRGTRLAANKSDCLVLDFVPARAPKIRLSSPADALAGEALPDDIAEQVRSASVASAENVLALVEQAQRNAEKKRKLLQVDAIYHTARLALDDLLSVANDMAPDFPRADEPATSRQVATLQDLGFRVEDINRGQAEALFNIVKKRKAAGLCTIKQARKLHAWGLPDDLTFDQARECLDIIAANGWRPPPWLRQRFRAA